MEKKVYSWKVSAGKNWQLPSNLFKIQGFTLVEMLLAISLSTLVMLTLAMGMNMVLKDWGRSSDYLEDNLEITLTLLQIERALNSAFTHVYFDQEENKEYLFFEGEEDELTWVSTVSPGRETGLTAWQLLPSEAEEGGIDIRTVPAFAGEPLENLEDAEPLSVLPGYKAYFEYLYIDNNSQVGLKKEEKWVKKWSAKKLQVLPQVVRIRLEKIVDKVDFSQEVIAVIMANEHKDFNRFKPVKP